jgi:hypothetical protein
MATRFAIHGRIVVWRGGRIVRDDTLLADAESYAEAQVAAGRMVDRGYRTWIFELRPGCGAAPVYTLVESRSGRTAAGTGSRPQPRSTGRPAGTAA